MLYSIFFFMQYQELTQQLQFYFCKGMVLKSFWIKHNTKKCVFNKKKRIKNMKCRKYPYNYKHLSHQSLIKAIIVRERDILMKFVCRYMYSNHENFNRFVFIFVHFAFTHFIITILCTRMTFLL